MLTRKYFFCETRHTDEGLHDEKQALERFYLTLCDGGELLNYFCLYFENVFLGFFMISGYLLNFFVHLVLPGSAGSTYEARSLSTPTVRLHCRG